MVTYGIMFYVLQLSWYTRSRPAGIMSSEVMACVTDGLRHIVGISIQCCGPLATALQISSLVSLSSSFVRTCTTNHGN